MGKYADEITFIVDDKVSKREKETQGKDVMLEEFIDPEGSIAWMFEPGIRQQSLV